MSLRRLGLISCRVLELGIRGALGNLWTDAAGSEIELTVSDL